MTFLELEKECKKRRFFRRLKILFAVLFLVLGGALGYLFFQKNKKDDKKPLKKVKEVKQVQPKPLKAPKKVIKKEKTKVEKLNLYLDLNVTDVTQKHNKKVISKNVTDKINKKEEKLLKTDTLPSFSTCMALAKKYYEKKDYKNALKWAKNANIQDNKRPDSWIISAKALYKLGKKDEALRILRVYYNYSKNKEVLKLIKELND